MGGKVANFVDLSRHEFPAVPPSPEEVESLFVVYGPMMG